MPHAGRNGLAIRGPLAGLTLALLSSSTAFAAGFERTVPGARENGRAGAVTAGGDSPMSLMYNPANIVAGDGTVRLEGALHLHMSERCMQRLEVVEDPGTGARSAGETYPNVCSEGPMGVLPELASSFRVHNQLALGFGVAVPAAATRAFHMGDPATFTIDPDGDGGNDPILTPTRYQLVEQELLQLFLTVAAAYQPIDQLRIGVGFGWGMTDVDFASASWAHLNVPNILGLDITADSEARTHLQGFDGFMPRFQAGIWAQPIRDVGFEVGASYSYTQNLNTTDTSLNVSTVQTTLQPDWAAALVDTSTIHSEATFDGVRLQVPQNSTLGFGMRYAQKLDMQVDDVGDRMSTERFDVELDLVATFNRRVDSFDVDLPDDASLFVESPLPGVVEDINAPLPDEISLEKRWKTQLAIRLGGDVNIVPGVFAVRAGASYETHGVQRGYEGLDFQPFATYGMHMGGTIRLGKKIDLSAAYTHIWQPDVTLGVEDAQVRRNVGGDADPNNPQDAQIVNAGTFTGRSNILVVSAAASF